MAVPIVGTPDNVTNVAVQALHPYFPLDAVIVDYAANEWSVPALLTVFFGACTLLFTSTYFVAKTIQPNVIHHLRVRSVDALVAI